MIVLNDFLLFLKRPQTEEKIEIKTASYFLQLIGISLLIMFCFAIVYGIVISTPLKIFNLIPIQKPIHLTLLNVLKITLFLPVIEEFLFRLPLKISKQSITISFSTLLFIVLNKTVGFIPAISASSATILILWFFLKNKSPFELKLNNFSTKYFIYILYTLALTFGLLHLGNFNLNIKLFFLFPLYIINQLFMGLLFGYLRVRYNYGIWLCIIVHVLINSIYALTHFAFN